jgi:hypothetical protein
MHPQSIGRFYLKRGTADLVVINLPGTQYELHLRPTGPAESSPQGRVRGIVRVPVWKLDTVTAGGAYIEPVYGRPRRVQGSVIGFEPGTNSVIVDICGKPIIGDLPPRWSAASVAPGSRVGLDVQEGGTFEPHATSATEPLDPAATPFVNLAAG